MCGDQVRNKDILGPVALLQRRSHDTPQLLVAERIRLVLQCCTRSVQSVSRLLGRRDRPLLLLVDMVAPRDVGEVVLLLL